MNRVQDDLLQLSYRRMKTAFFICAIVIGLTTAVAQDSNFRLKGDYSTQDSLDLRQAYMDARMAVDSLQKDMLLIWNAEGDNRAARVSAWNQNPRFIRWLGASKRIGKTRRMIRRIDSKFDKQMTLLVSKSNRGRCKGWISAWTLPFGTVRLRFCDNYFRYRTHLQAKTLVHELGHEAGLLFDRRIQGCRSALRAASTHESVAKKSPENYAWLAMSYLDMDCSR